MYLVAVFLAFATVAVYVQLVLATIKGNPPILGHIANHLDEGSIAYAGAVSSESALCSRVGIDLLKAGGNAADAVCVRFKPGRATVLTALPRTSSLVRFSVWV